MSSNLNLKKILSYLIFLAPISFIVGAAIVELIFTFYLIFFYLIYKEKIIFFDFKKISLFFLIFFIYLNFNSLLL